MIGYTCAMLRYYHPLEFITAFLNNARGEDDISKGTSYAKSKGFVIKAPKFGHASNEYVCDKETNTIYKGLGSIKSMQSISADIMNEIAKQKPESFVDILYLSNEIRINGKKINSKSLDILIDIGFFSEYGNIDTIKQIRYGYEKFAKRKVIKKESLRDWEIDLVRENAEKETEKQFSKINTKALLEDWLAKMPKLDDDTQALILNQIEHLGYVDVDGYDVPLDYYVVQKAHKDKWNRIWLSLFHLKSNQSCEYKCDAKWFKKHECVPNDVIKAAFRSKEKVKLLGVDENGKKVWSKSNEYENVISCYEIISTENVNK